MNMKHRDKESFKKIVEEYLKDDFEVIFKSGDYTLGEINKHTPYQVVNLYEEIYGHRHSLYTMEIGKRAYIKLG